MQGVFAVYDEVLRSGVALLAWLNIYWMFADLKRSAISLKSVLIIPINIALALLACWAALRLYI